jgi:hypothetical protein
MMPSRFRGYQFVQHENVTVFYMLLYIQPKEQWKVNQKIV